MWLPAIFNYWSGKQFSLNTLDQLCIPAQWMTKGCRSNALNSFSRFTLQFSPPWYFECLPWGWALNNSLNSYGSLQSNCYWCNRQVASTVLDVLLLYCFFGGLFLWTVLRLRYLVHSIPRKVYISMCSVIFSHLWLLLWLIYMSIWSSAFTLEDKPCMRPVIMGPWPTLRFFSVGTQTCLNRSHLTVTTQVNTHSTFR